MGNQASAILHSPSFAIETPDLVTGFFVSPNKKYLLIGYDQQNIRVYDLDSETKEAGLIDIEGSCYSKVTWSVTNVSFSHDSTLVAYRYKESLRIMNLATLRIIKEIEIGHPWGTVAFSPNSKMLAVGGIKDVLSIYDLSKGT
jgi:WD40 repeat protein